MKRILRLFPLTFCCLVVIWILCFCTPPHTRLDNVAFIDKWTHFVMYCGTLSVFWFEYWRATKKGFRLSSSYLWLWSVIVPILMSGLIEILQANCTGGRRSGDWLDFAANSVGVILGLLIGRTLLRKLLHA